MQAANQSTCVAADEYDVIQVIMHYICYIRVIAKYFPNQIFQRVDTTINGNKLVYSSTSELPIQL